MWIYTTMSKELGYVYLTTFMHTFLIPLIMITITMILIIVIIIIINKRNTSTI